MVKITLKNKYIYISHCVGHENSPIHLKSWCEFSQFLKEDGVKINEIVELVLNYHCIESWADCPYFENLENLSMCYNNIESFDNCLEKNFPKLKSLNLKNNKLKSLKGLPMFNNLIELNLSDNRITTLEGMPLFPRLKRLYLDNNDSLTNWNGCPTFQNLKYLSLVQSKNNELIHICDKFPRLEYVNYALYPPKIMYGNWEFFHMMLLDFTTIMYKFPVYIICQLFDEVNILHTGKKSFTFWRHADKIKLISKVKKEIELLKCK